MVRIRTHQLRVLRALSSGGSLSSYRISRKAGIAPPTVRICVGISDPERRKEFEATPVDGHVSRSGNKYAKGGFPSLITLGFVRMDVFDIDGKKETAYSLTRSGWQALEELKDIVLPPVKSARGQLLADEE